LVARHLSACCSHHPACCKLDQLVLLCCDRAWQLHR